MSLTGPVVLQVLCSWLSNSPNYEEITKWYLGWKSMFSDQVLAHPSIKDKFNEALDIMNRAVSSSVGRWLPVVAAQQRLVLVRLCLGIALLISTAAAPVSIKNQKDFYFTLPIVIICASLKHKLFFISGACAIRVLILFSASPGYRVFYVRREQQRPSFQIVGF